MRLYGLILCSLLHLTSAQSSTFSAEASDSSFVVSGTRVFGGSTITGPVSVPTGPYSTYTGQIDINSSLSSEGRSSNNRSHSSSSESSAASETTLVGSFRSSSTSRNNASTTTTSKAPVNTQPCNGYAEFCNRKYSNITQVCAHNSAFVVPGNAASNQAIPILGQLNDGIRMIQGETHHVNGTMYSCHTSCDLLNAGPLVYELETVASWVKANPYDVVTILLVNSDFVDVENYVEPILASGLEPYLFLPSKLPMQLDDWPTLGEMILAQSRVVIFMDYNANQTKVPYVLDEFSQMWETPFSPTDPSFPCTQQRPPQLPEKQARDEYLYLLNQNLNVQLSIAGSTILIPNFAQLSEVNADKGYKTVSSLGNTTERCTQTWDRPPNFLLVDFYNYGNFNGSVFEVAAKYNNVTYHQKCCGLDIAVSVAKRKDLPVFLMTFTFIFAWLLLT